MLHRRPMRRWMGVALVLTASAAGCTDAPTDAARVRACWGATGMGRGEFAYPRGLAVSPVDGRVFVVDKAARIQRFSPRGDYECEWRMPEWDRGKPTGLCVGADGRVWVADTHYSRVIVFDRDGHELLRFGTNGTGPGQFVWPTNVALDADGFAYVGEYGGNDRINKFTPQGGYVLSFAHGDAATGGVARPQGLAFDVDGRLWVADAAHHRICSYSRDGAFLNAFGSMGGGPGQFRYPYELAIRSDGTLFVSDYGNNRVLHLDRTGRVLGKWGAPGRERGCIRHAWSLDLDRAGLLYVLDSWNNRVQVVSWD